MDSNKLKIMLHEVIKNGYVCDLIKNGDEKEMKKKMEYDEKNWNKVKLENIEKEIKQGYFINYVSTSSDINVARIFQADQGCILKFHPSMRRAYHINSCEVKWISPYKDEQETIFQRSYLHNQFI